MKLLPMIDLSSLNWAGFVKWSGKKGANVVQKGLKEGGDVVLLVDFLELLSKCAKII